MVEMKESWFRRHWILTIILVIITFWIVHRALNFDNGGFNLGDSNKVEKISGSALTKDYCSKIQNKQLRNQCLAYEKIDGDYCSSFSSQEEIDKCYYDLSTHGGNNYCSNISTELKKWECKAIYEKDTSVCRYSSDEYSCLINYLYFYKDESACNLLDNRTRIETQFGNETQKEICIRVYNDIVNSYGKTQEQREEENIKNMEEQKICSDFTDGCDSQARGDESRCLFCEALNSGNYTDCLLINNNDLMTRDVCLLTLADNRDACDEISDSSLKNSCYDGLGSKDINICIQIQDYTCLTNAFLSIGDGYSDQNISYTICDQFGIKDEIGLTNCYIAYAKAELK